MIFKPCNGECTEEGTHCAGCGRSHEEVADMRRLVGALVAYAEEMEYENVDDFANGVANGIRFAMKGEH
ncbi:MAG: DUF1289 domain-containing protein [Xanthomonadales bacterium]